MAISPDLWLDGLMTWWRQYILTKFCCCFPFAAAAKVGNVSCIRLFLQHKTYPLKIKKIERKSKQADGTGYKKHMWPFLMLLFEGLKYYINLIKVYSNFFPLSPTRLNKYVLCLKVFFVHMSKISFFLIQLDHPSLSINEFWSGIHKRGITGHFKGNQKWWSNYANSIYCIMLEKKIVNF